MRRMMVAGATLAMMVAGCSPTNEAAEPATNRTAPAPLVTATPTTAATQAASSNTTETATGTPDDAPSPFAQGIVACAQEMGSAAAERLVKQCRALSPATHPPCNVQNSCAMIRGEIARSCAIIADGGTAPADCPAPPTSAAAAVEVIRNYYSAIDARDYATAWQLWDGNGARSGKSLDAFAAGFRGTVSSFVSPGSPGRIEGAAGSSYVTVPVTVRARTTDGTRQQFTGDYVLRRTNVGLSQGWRIYSATLKPS